MERFGLQYLWEIDASNVSEEIRISKTAVRFELTTGSLNNSEQALHLSIRRDCLDQIFGR